MLKKVLKESLRKIRRWFSKRLLFFYTLYNSSIFSMHIFYQLLAALVHYYLCLEQQLISALYIFLMIMIRFLLLSMIHLIKTIEDGSKGYLTVNTLQVYIGTMAVGLLYHKTISTARNSWSNSSLKNPALLEEHSSFYGLDRKSIFSVDWICLIFFGRSSSIVWIINNKKVRASNSPDLKFQTPSYEFSMQVKYRQLSRLYWGTISHVA